MYKQIQVTTFRIKKTDKGYTYQRLCVDFVRTRHVHVVCHMHVENPRVVNTYYKASRSGWV